MIILAIDSRASWGFNTHDFNVTSPSLFGSSWKINWLCLCVLSLFGFLGHFGKWFFKFFVPFLLGSALYIMSQYLHLSAPLLPFSLISSKWFQHSALWVHFLATCLPLLLLCVALCLPLSTVRSGPAWSLVRSRSRPNNEQPYINCKIL